MMNRRSFVGMLPAAGAALTVPRPSRQLLHLSVDKDSPYYFDARSVAGVMLNGERITGCCEASEIDGFVIQSCHRARNNLHLLREPGAVLIPMTEDRAPRVKRFGVVRIILHGETE